MVQEDVAILLTDVHPVVRRALLAEMPRLCIFFGKQKSNDFLISHIITYLNDPDWLLRAAFCEAIVGIGTFVGQQSLEQFILPMLIMALTDAEEFVVEKVLNSLSSLAELGLIQKPKLKELTSVIAPLLSHPNRWILYGAIGFLNNVVKVLPAIDVKCVVYPLVRPFLKTDCLMLTEGTLIENIKSPIKRDLYEYTIEYAIKEELNQTKIGNWDRDEQDLLSSLREMGMSPEDKDKLVEMKYYISKTAKARQRAQISATHLQEEFDYIALRDHNVIPHTVFLTPLQFVNVSLPNESYTSRNSSPKLPSSYSSPQKFDDFEDLKKKPPVTPNASSFLAPSRQQSRASLSGLELSPENIRTSTASIQRTSGISAMSARSRNVSVNEINSSMPN
jgi:phosphoinositide-3-kinase, regulatory subunit 4